MSLYLPLFDVETRRDCEGAVQTRKKLLGKVQSDKILKYVGGSGVQIYLNLVLRLMASGKVK